MEIFNNYPKSIIEHIYNDNYILPTFVNNKYSFSEIENKHKNYIVLYDKILKEMEGIDKNKLYEIKQITDFLARGVKRYINRYHKLDHRISNAFTKLWEMFIIEPRLIPDNITDLYTFHMAEAPGQFIYCIYKFIEKNRKNIKNFNWRANSLVPEDINDKDYDISTILGDDYGFIKNNPEQWLWGEDKTGDITHIVNIKGYREYIKNWTNKIHLVTGDAGVPLFLGLEFMQKLEVAQMVLTLATCLKGGTCLIKHFVPYVMGVEKSLTSSGFYMCLLYSYAIFFDEIKIVKPITSKPNGGEYYLLGIGFKGITDEQLEKFYNVLDNYKENMCWFNKNDIPEDFQKAVINFTLNLMTQNIKYDNIRLGLYQLYKKDKYNQSMNIKFHEKNREQFYKKWINDNKFNG